MNKVKKDYDFVPVLLDEGLASTTFEYITEGATLGVKASIYVEDEFVSVIAEKLTFINTK